MINIESFNKCICQSVKKPVDMCADVLTLQEKGKKIKLTPKRGEEAIALVMDGCVVKGKKSTCDGLFLLKSPHKKWIIPVELKGSHLYDAFQQLVDTIQHLPEFKKISDEFEANESVKINKISFIVSNAIFNSKDKAKLENIHKIRVKSILHSTATKPIEDIRKYI
jgi:hypothetical protein